MKRFKFGMFIADIAFWVGYVIEAVKLGYYDGKTTAQSEID